MKRVYVDTSVLVYHFVRQFNASFSNKARDFLLKVEKGTYEAMISLYALMELEKQLRELMVKSNVCLRTDWDTNIKSCLKAIYKMQNVKIIEAITTDEEQIDIGSLLHSELAWDTFNIMTKYPGNIKLNRNNGQFNHDGLHPVDAVHLALAKKTGCLAIATFDRDFRETNSEVQSLLLMEDTF